MSEDRCSVAGGHVLAYASGAAAASGVIKLFLPFPGSDVAPLTAITKSMCDNVTAIYGYQSLKGLSEFIGVLIGAAEGMTLAAEVSSFIPVIGAGANAVAMFTLHALTGFALILVFELLGAGEITEEDVRATPVGLVSRILGSATDVVANVIKGGSIPSAVEGAKREFVASSTEIKP